ncbi:hypothetical protein H114_32724 [Streptomyces gancidicus BKS 13-15]|uniref:Portal protein n=1 Tax=Streptomyces gancidicus BKS 13-15 TaxID=1284664 RepID=M3DG95_STREZ|nr:hypothetical protein [Streptomyces gancidicus]EMF20406.1 hypothetical protein H114_32724 [Streptomyces gancidicus BKS 13-15]
MSRRLLTGPAPLTAAAARFTAPKRSRGQQKKPDASWQAEAWSFFEKVPEVRFAGTWIGNAMGGATLYAGRRTTDGTIERLPDEHPAAQIVQQIAGGPDGQSNLLADMGPHFVVAGEGWIVVCPILNAAGQVTGYDWRVLSTSEVSQQSGKLVVEIDGEPVDVPPYDPDGEYDHTAPIAIRVWKPFPGRHIEADSPVRSSLQLLEELQLLNAAVAAIARSRLTGRGVLLIPKGTRFPTAPGAPSDAEDDVIDIFMEVAATAIREPDSAAATVPIVLEVPADSIGGIKWLQFESDFDDLAIRLREEAIRRFANGLEVPAEILLGLGDANHWSAWALTAEAIRLGVEPRLAIICHALTTQWLRPLLEDDDADDAEDYLVWYDTSGLRVQANRAQTALEAFKAGLISAAAARRETGFDEADAPDAPLPGDDEHDADSDSTDEDNPTTDETSLPVSETTSIPDTLPASPLPEAVLAAVDGLIWNALYAAGVRLRNRPACPRTERARAREIVPAELHTQFPVEPEYVDEWRLLDGAWVRVPEIAARYGLDADCLTRVLDDYARALIAARHPHTYDDTVRVLRTPCIAEAA